MLIKFPDNCLYGVRVAGNAKFFILNANISRGDNHRVTVHCVLPASWELAMSCLKHASLLPTRTIYNIRATNITFSIKFSLAH